MPDLTPSFLLSHPELVSPVAPWCARLDNLELGVLLLAQPWLAGGGLRRADLERQLTRLAAELPLGPVYFQRVKRAVARLEDIGALEPVGEDRGRRFRVTPRGFAAFLLNLRVLDADPTLDGSEFELKRALVALWNLIFERLAQLPDEAPLPPETERFLGEVERLTVLGQRLITERLIGDALDVLRLVATQRERVERLLSAARQRLSRAETAAGALSELDLSRLAGQGLGSQELGTQGLDGAAALLAGAPGALGMVRELASGTLPRLSLSASVLRYTKYLEYLDELTALYAGELESIAPGTLREVLSRHTG